MNFGGSGGKPEYPHRNEHGCADLGCLGASVIQKYSLEKVMKALPYLLWLDFFMMSVKSGHKQWLKLFRTFLKYHTHDRSKHQPAFLGIKCCYV